MLFRSTFKTNVAYNKKVEQNPEIQSPNPLRLKANLSSLTALSNYNQVLLKPKFDKDSAEILNRVGEMTNISPDKLKLPYSFKLDEINGERIYAKDGRLKVIREYETDTVRQYYPADDNIHAGKILEIDKNSGTIVSKIEPVIQPDGTIKTNIIVFDGKINNKYTMFQVEDNGTISSITEIFEKGKNFRTLFRNPETAIPERYIEALENKDGEFEVIDCRLNPEVQEIKRTTAAKEVNIKYENNQKIIDVKRKIPEV